MDLEELEETNTRTTRARSTRAGSTNPQNTTKQPGRTVVPKVPKRKNRDRGSNGEPEAGAGGDKETRKGPARKRSRITEDGASGNVNGGAEKEKEKEKEGTPEPATGLGGRLNGARRSSGRKASLPFHGARRTASGMQRPPRGALESGQVLVSASLLLLTIYKHK